ncbi:hypothetical protein TNCV_3495931 [Trichonephila clavipes]|nr:hypothetical protein TNCV_3495931 [Trichonephila clavipes]
MQILRPTLIYACPIRGHAAHSNINQIEIAQNLILRTITKADWYIRNADIRSALNIKNLKECLPRNGAYLLIRILELRAEIVMGRTILLERRQSESVGRRNSRTTFLRSDWPRPFARREVGVEMELGRSENKRPEQRRS